MGVIGARGGREWNNKMIKEADVVLFAATSTDSANTDGWNIPSPASGQKFIQIDISERELGNNYDALPLFGDVRETLADLAAALKGMPRPDRGAWAARCAEEKAAHEKRLEGVMARYGDELHPLSLVRAIERLTPDTAFFAVDPGSSAIYSSCFLRIGRAGRRAAYNFSMGGAGLRDTGGDGGAVRYGGGGPRDRAHRRRQLRLLRRGAGDGGSPRAEDRLRPFQ